MDKTPRASRRPSSSALPPTAPSRPAWAVTKGPDDWIIWDGPAGTGSYALGPITQGWGDLSAWRSLGSYTSFPHLAIGWATREEALAVIASLHPDRQSKCRIQRRKVAVARFERVRGGSYELYREGVCDWGTSKG